MSFQSVHQLNSYPQQQVSHPPHPTSSSCIMLPPLHSVPSTTQLTNALTLSDCSELSASSRDDNTHSNNIMLHPYPVAPSVSTHSNPSAPLQLAHSSSAAQPSVATTMPATVSSTPRTPSTALSTRSKISKTPKKIARARTKLPSKPSAEQVGGQSPTYRPTTTKKVRSSKSNIPGESRYWTPSEHKLFVEALLKYGPKDLKSISAYVGTRNMIQCRTHEQKCFMRLMREAQRETFQRTGEEFEHADERRKVQKDVYSVPSSCGITLLCVVGEEMSRSLQS